jgi:hypothetical protein
MRETILAMSTNGSSTASSTIKSEDTGTLLSAPGPIVFVITASVFYMTPPPCCILPVPIQLPFLHITLQLGSTLGCGNCPAICYVVDTAVHFFAEIAKAYPHTVVSIHSQMDYSPLL